MWFTVHLYLNEHTCWAQCHTKAWPADACEEACLLFCSWIVIATLEVYGTVLLAPSICFYKTLLSMVLANGVVLILLSICRMYLIMHSGSGLCAGLFICQASRRWQNERAGTETYDLTACAEIRQRVINVSPNNISLFHTTSLLFTFLTPHIFHSF